MSNIPRDKELYEKIKKEITDKYKPSAYRSGLIVKKYKEEYEKKHKNKNAYEGKKKTDKGLSRWFDEVWLNQRGEVGYKKKNDVYRPTKKISKDTPTTFQELSKKELEKAMKEKGKSGRVKRFASG